jgi:hypothetical protein
MHIAYSALRPQNEHAGKIPGEQQNKIQLRYRAYLDACNKYHDHIAEIQKYFPGWAPKFR